MSASATLPVASSAPDPDRVAPDAPPPGAFPRVGRLLVVLHKLVAFGTSLLSTLQAGASAHQQARTMHVFGTQDLALIVGRIKCGLLRAAGLEGRLNGFVKRGRDLRPAPLRTSMPRARQDDVLGADGPVIDVKAVLAADIAELGLDEVASDLPGFGVKGADTPGPARHEEVLSRLPSAEEIAEQVRTRPIGVVINDICRDLGLRPGMIDGVMWRELKEALLDCGFSLAKFLRGCRTPLLGAAYREVAFSVSAFAALVEEELLAAIGQPP